jgi:hypothetical protein
MEAGLIKGLEIFKKGPDQQLKNKNRNKIRTNSFMCFGL